MVPGLAKEKRKKRRCSGHSPESSAGHRQLRLPWTARSTFQLGRGAEGARKVCTSCQQGQDGAKKQRLCQLPAWKV